MDSLTQIVLGASVAEAALGKKIGNKAILWGAIAGTIPDLDVFLKYFTDEITSTQMHRGFSHSILFAIIAAPILGWLVFRLYKVKEATQKQWSWMFFWAIFTHPLLDAHTTWGTQLFWPFEYRLAYKNIFVADPLYTLPFLVLVIAVMFYKRTNPKRTKLNNLALIVSASYMVLTLGIKTFVHFQFTKALKEQKIDYVEIDTQPAPLNAVLWSAQIETKKGVFGGYYSLLDSKPIVFQKEIPKNHQLLKPYENQKEVRQILDISAGWYYVEKVHEGFVFTDVRFGQFGFKPDSPYMWQYDLKLRKKGKLTVSRKHFNPVKGQFKSAFAELWTRIKGN